MTSTEDDDIFDRLMSAFQASPKSPSPFAHVDSVFVHILQTLESSVLLYSRGFIPIAAFLAITAIEELAKLRFLMFGSGSTSSSRGKDPAFSHLEKQALGAGVLPISLRPRLVDACGEEVTANLLSLARSGGLIRIREQCLYFEKSDHRLLIPDDEIDRDLARNILLLAIDEYDDEISGWTSKSYAYGERATELFAIVLSAA